MDQTDASIAAALQIASQSEDCTSALLEAAELAKGASFDVLDRHWDTFLRFAVRHIPNTYVAIVHFLAASSARDFSSNFASGGGDSMQPRCQM